MTSLIIIGICIVGLVIHLTIGHISALKLASKVAELSNRKVNGTGLLEYEWMKTDKKTDWILEGWTKVDSESWGKTGRTRKMEPDDIKFDQDWFTGRMALIRQLWFIGVPVTLANSVDNKMIEKYDPSVAERKARQQDTRIKELEKELSIGESAT